MQFIIRNKKAVILWLATGIWTYIMFALSGQSAEDSARLSGGLTAYILRAFAFLDMPYDDLEHILRKLAHFCMFGVEGILMYASVKAGLKNHAGTIAAGICAVIAALNEYTQTFFEGRSCELRDVAIDFAGACMGIAAGVICYYLIKSRRRA